VVLWGLSIGSFTTCVVYRIPRGLSLWRNKDGSMRSFCPNCQAELHAKDLVPVFSWLLQKGRCRYCGQPIPPRYLWIEIASLVAVILLAILLGFSWWFFAASLLVPIGAGLFVFLQRGDGL
ncbi:MAG: leader peptidase PppA, partial [Alphaproteobacteria bacterium]|nr:leader peptidase PppA [Alphaproteobacteria bacterium]